MSTRVARIVFFALGLIAVSALLAQPICEAMETHVAQTDEGDSCCSTVAPDVLPTPPLATGLSLPVTAHATSLPVFRPHMGIRGALPAVAPPVTLRYYLRSARIQR